MSHTTVIETEKAGLEDLGIQNFSLKGPSPNLGIQLPLVSPGRVVILT
jgi:hypothetical protein